ncbi:MAG: cation:dicarboxylate symporter family transporter [Culicoidibacterales bacterium]
MFTGPFFEQFLFITSPMTIIAIAILIGAFIFMFMLQKKRVKFSTRMFIALGLAIGLGVALQLIAGLPADPSTITWLDETRTWYSLFGSGFTKLLQMLVIPIVFISIVRVVMNLEGQNLGKMTGRTIAWMLGTTAVAAVIGIVLANAFQLGQGLELASSSVEPKEVTTLVTTMLNLIPSNPIAIMSEGNVIALVIFASFIGIATMRMGKRKPEVIAPFKDLIEAAYQIIMSVAMTIIKLMPYGVIALLAGTIVGRGLDAILSVGMVVVVIYLAIVIQFMIHMGILSVHGLNPVSYLRKGYEPLVLAFTSRSSMGTLPVTVETLTEKLGVNGATANLVSSLGTTMGMNGCAGIYPAVLAVMLARMTGIPMDAQFYVLLVVVVTLGSVGIAGIPGTATVSASVTLNGVGLGSAFSYIGPVLGIDPILDMGRTMLNVNGTMVTAVVVDKSLGTLDIEKFHSKDQVFAEDIEVA